MIDLRWSDRILEEVNRVLLRRLGIEAESLRRLEAALTSAFPEASVTVEEKIEQGLALPDPDDCHVLAAAIGAECDLLVTDNVRDFPDSVVAPHDMLVVDVDSCLQLLAAEFGAALGPIIHTQINALHRPEMTTEDFLRRLALRAPVGAAAIGAAAGLPSSELAYAEILRTADEDPPHAVVSNIVRSVSEHDASGLRRCIDSAFAEELFSQASPTDSAALSVLAAILEDVGNEDGWASRLRGGQPERTARSSGTSAADRGHA